MDISRIKSIVRYYGKFNSIRRFQTDCCALAQLSLNNSHTIKQIQEVVETIKKETNNKWSPNDRGGGERAIFVITTPTESILEAKLEEVGFKEVTQFNRRNGYPAGILKMWIISW